MYKYALCELYIPKKVDLTPPPSSKESVDEVVQILIHHIQENNVEILSFNKYYGETECEVYDEENDNKPGTYIVVSIEMLEVLWKSYKLRKNWKKHKPLLLELIRREVLYSEYELPCKMLSEKEQEIHIAIVKDYD